MTSGQCRVGFLSSRTPWDTLGGIFKIDSPSILLLVLPLGISLVPSPGIRVPILVGIGATVAPPPMATPKFGVGTPNAGDTPTCGHGK